MNSALAAGCICLTATNSDAALAVRLQAGPGEERSRKARDPVASVPARGVNSAASASSTAVGHWHLLHFATEMSTYCNFATELSTYCIPAAQARLPELCISPQRHSRDREPLWAPPGRGKGRRVDPPSHFDVEMGTHVNTLYFVGRGPFHDWIFQNRKHEHFSVN
jgi:hypothetical protein